MLQQSWFLNRPRSRLILYIDCAFGHQYLLNLRRIGRRMNSHQNPACIQVGLILNRPLLGNACADQAADQAAA